MSGVPITGPLRRGANDTSAFEIARNDQLKGVMQIVANAAGLSGIPAELLVIGGEARTLDTGRKYVLTSMSPVTWTIQPAGFDPTAPGPIGGTTPSTVAATTINASNVNVTGNLGGAGAEITADGIVANGVQASFSIDGPIGQNEPNVIAASVITASEIDVPVIVSASLDVLGQAIFGTNPPTQPSPFPFNTVDLDGTVAGGTFFSKVGSVYTLLQDLQTEGLIVESGVTLITAGFKIFCRTSLTVNAGGVIHNDGVDGVLGVGAASSRLGTTGVGTGGGAGGVNSVGTPGVDQNNSISGPNIIGGNGGAGGANAGGAGGAYNQSPQLFGGAFNLFSMTTGCTFTVQAGGSSSLVRTIGGGAGGGGGGSNNALRTGGGGGSGAGVMILAARTFTNKGTIRCAGGKGANASGTAGAAGGGAGGGGGIIMITYRVAGTGNVFPSTSFDVLGGNGGTGLGGGANGGPALAGLVMIGQV